MRKHYIKKIHILNYDFRLNNLTFAIKRAFSVLNL